MSIQRVLLVGIGDFATGFQSGRPRAVHEALRDLVPTSLLELGAASRHSFRLARVLNSLGQTHRLPTRERGLLRRYTDALNRAIDRTQPDLVLSTTSLVFDSPVNAPSLGWPDAPLNLMLDSTAYPHLGALTPAGRARFEDAERRAIQNQDVAAFPTRRGARFARELSPTANARTYAFGQNADHGMLHEVQLRRRNTTAQPEIDLLFVGVDWLRKGGAIALRAVELLRGRGIPARLVVVGACPVAIARHPHVRYLGHLYSRNPADRAVIVDEMARATALIFPTRADNFGAVAAEAALAGLPVLTSPHAGVAEYVESHGFGLVLPEPVHDAAAIAADYADAVETLLGSRAETEAMSARGIAAAASTLNYRISLERMLDDVADRKS